MEINFNNLNNNKIIIAINILYILKSYVYLIILPFK